MHRLKVIMLFVLFVCISSFAVLSQDKMISAGTCLDPNQGACGCHFVVKKKQCAKGEADCNLYLYTDLGNADPLCIASKSQTAWLPSLTPNANRFETGETEQYGEGTTSATLTYLLAPSTCTKPKEDVDGCEFVDRDVKMVMKVKGRPVRHYFGRGSCGC